MSATEQALHDLFDYTTTLDAGEAVYELRDMTPMIDALAKGNPANTGPMAMVLLLCMERLLVRVSEPGPIDVRKPDGELSAKGLFGKVLATSILEKPS